MQIENTPRAKEALFIDQGLQGNSVPLSGFVYSLSPRTFIFFFYITSFYPGQEEIPDFFPEIEGEKSFLTF
jgi:hypothetical protein